MQQLYVWDLAMLHQDVTALVMNYELARLVIIVITFCRKWA